MSDQMITQVEEPPGRLDRSTTIVSRLSASRDRFDDAEDLIRGMYRSGKIVRFRLLRSYDGHLENSLLAIER